MVVVVCVAIGLYIGLYLVNVPGSVAATQTAAGAQLYLATVPAAEPSDPHPTWVSYYAVKPVPGTGGTRPRSCCRPTRSCT